MESLYPQLMEMGFEPEQIEECQVAMAQSSQPFSLQAAAEWLLQKAQRGPPASSRPPVLTLGPPTQPSPSQQPEVQGAVSSSQHIFPSQPVKSRYSLDEEQVREKERYLAKEREDVTKRAKEQRKADIRARQAVKQQIADDKKARQLKSKRPTLEGGGERQEERERAGQRKGDALTGSSKDGEGPSLQMCRVQVRLPSGRVLRHTFPPTTQLQEVSAFVLSNDPQLLAVQLVQPFPHHEFTADEASMTLDALGLCPSASLVVSRQSRPVEVGDAGMEVGAGVEAPPSALGGYRRELEQMFSHGQATGGAGVRPGSVHPGFPLSGGHKLSGDDVMSSPSEDRPQTERRGEDRGAYVLDRRRPQVRDDEGGEAMDIEEEEDEGSSPASDSDSDSDSNLPPPLPLGFPALPPRGALPPAFRQPPMGPGRGGRVRIPPGGMPRLMQGMGGDDVFGGHGHLLGGKDEPVLPGDAQRRRENMQEAAKAAAVKRYKIGVPPPADRVSRLHSSIPSLEVLCMRTLVSLSWTYGLPSCAPLTPRAAQRLMAALVEEKRLNTKTLAAFHGCPLQKINLDNYIYATNELLSALWYFHSLTHLSLVSCTIITDKALNSLFPYLSGLTHLNLNGCRQLTEGICRSIRTCKSMEVLQVSQVKLTDKGVRLLLHEPLGSLRELDLSHTLISSRTLELLPSGCPNLQVLRIESTSVDDLTPLCRLERLNTLSVAHCLTTVSVGTLKGCGRLQSLNLSGIAVDMEGLEQLAGLQLHTLRLPDRNIFFDDAVEIVSGFPLASLNLMDYCYVTDVGVACLTGMNTLMELSLGRTKLTDNGMVFLQGLTNLRRLSLDNTVITDEGVKYIADLSGLEDLSLSDTRVTSQFIVDGVLRKMGLLSKLNLSRTGVCDRGIMKLGIPSLTMLNLDWTCVTEAVTLNLLRAGGCPVLETLRNRNIGQPLSRGHGRSQERMVEGGGV